MGRASLDMIARCGFAADIGSFEEGAESPFVTQMKGIFNIPIAKSLILCKRNRKAGASYL